MAGNISHAPCTAQNTILGLEKQVLAWHPNSLPYPTEGREGSASLTTSLPPPSELLRETWNGILNSSAQSQAGDSGPVSQHFLGVCRGQGFPGGQELGGPPGSVRAGPGSQHLSHAPARSRAARGHQGSPGHLHLHGDGDRPRLGWDMGSWVLAQRSPGPGRAGQGRGELETSSAVALLGQGLTVPGD
ncbi:hypothetical protein QYF61_009316 [Mycteria americana]|uniref:Uncharacterized protein n=1 Tax=Mycteria americana TaxID=33587 RepID=A0AAN7NRK5_MYCAM|nr:hypothetical protein QYF61_009316 [Mycteria americana]